MRAPTLQRWVHFVKWGAFFHAAANPSLAHRNRTWSDRSRTLRVTGPLAARNIKSIDAGGVGRKKDVDFSVDIVRMVANIFTCPGDVAQLGERLGRIEEVEGSIPFVSTTGYVKASVTRPFSYLSSLLSPRCSGMHRPQAQGCASKHTRCVMRLTTRTRPASPPHATSLDITRVRGISDGMLYITHRLRTRSRARGVVPTPRQKPQTQVTAGNPQRRSPLRKAMP